MYRLLITLEVKVIQNLDASQIKTLQIMKIMRIMDWLYTCMRVYVLYVSCTEWTRYKTFLVIQFHMTFFLPKLCVI